MARATLSVVLINLRDLHLRPTISEFHNNVLQFAMFLPLSNGTGWLVLNPSFSFVLNWKHVFVPVQYMFHFAVGEKYCSIHYEKPEHLPLF